MLSWLGRSTGSDAACKTYAASWARIHAAKVDLYLHQQGIDTTTPGGKALFQMMGVFAELLVPKLGCKHWLAGG